MNKPQDTQGSDNNSYPMPDNVEFPPTSHQENSPVLRAEASLGDWDSVVEAYVNSAVDSPNTRRAYRRHLLNARTILQVASVDEVTGQELALYRSWVTGTNLSPASQAQCLAAVRAFFGWVSDLGGQAPGRQVVKAALKTPRGLTAGRYAVLTESEVERILSTTSATPRENALMAVLLGSGLRVSEVSKLELRDVIEDLDGGIALHVRQGKGRKDRTVPIGPEVEAAIKEYVVHTGRYLGERGPLFRAQDRGAPGRSVAGLSPRAISRIVRESATAAGISAKRISPHSMRHSYATRCLRSGANVMAVAKLLGHASIATTQKYIDHLALSELRSAVPPLPMRGQIAAVRDR